VSAVQRKALRALAAAALFGLPIAAYGCIQRGYPLASGGQVDIRVDVASALFATDTLDADGKPAGPRQAPHQTGVSLYLTEGGAPAFGAFVSVRVEPPEALVLRPAKDENTEEPTCEAVEGSFRCFASREGFARFVASSESDWSGDANIIVSWADQTKDRTIEVLPPGLPDSATNFTMVVGLDAADTVLATFSGLKCSKYAIPEDLGSKWRDGGIRFREARVRATPPVSAPAVLENAPVIVESLYSEAALSLDAACTDRQTRLRLLLDATGQSPRFHLCFSDIGGEASFAITSGQKGAIEPNPTIQVEPEPRLLRVRPVQSVVELGKPIDLFEVSAYNVNRIRIPIPVDLKSSDDQVMNLAQASLTLAGEENPATLVEVDPAAVGTALLHVTPRLLSSPACASDPITVEETPP
jgi:hypothetical protein